MYNANPGLFMVPHYYRIGDKKQNPLDFYRGDSTSFNS